ncbi:hypothetical protein [Massilia sp. TWP1-3-3]|uniref:hypothetical protein n=1 Tax=Massilia sp. TWP1-3-3 TaxID=2804573 RepID=UPI003CF764BF
MKTTFLSIALVIASIGAAQAQNADMQNGVPLSAQPAQQAQLPQSAQPQQQPARLAVKKTHFMIGMGITGGGDDIATTEFTDGSSQTIHSGGLVAFTVGVEHRINEQFSVQGNVGFHVDNSTAKNGDIHFRRYPIEVIGYYHVSPKWRFGTGIRHVTNVRLKSSGVIDGYDTEFDNTTGALGEVEYMFSPSAGVKVRYVREKYTVSGTNYKFDGNHVGLFGNYYF